MAPLPEKIAKVESVQDALTHYTVAAKAHNAVLAENERLKQRIRWFERQMFGAKSEKLKALIPEQQALQDLLAVAEAQSPIVAESLPPAEKPPRRRLVHKEGKDGGHGWGEIPPHLERVDVPETLTEAQRQALAQGTLIKVREEISERLAIRPQSVYVKRFIRSVFAQAQTDGGRTILPLAPLECAIERGRADKSILAFLVVQKFCDHLPFDRVRKILLRQDVELSTSTMCTWMADLHTLLEPLYRAMILALKKTALILADETPCPVLLEGKSSAHQGYIWVYVGGGEIVYVYTKGRGSEYPRAFLTGYTGTLLSDGYAVYDRVCPELGIVRAGCHAHARRKFVDALALYPKAREVVELYGQLFAIDAEATKAGLSAATRLELRQERSRSVWEAILRWAKSKAQHVLPKDALGQAITYLTGQETALSVFLKDGAVPLSNNESERALRAVVLGRKNYMFFASEAGAERGALFYSLVQSCVRNKVNPQAYLESVIEEIGSVPMSRIEELLPSNWARRGTPVAR